MGESSSPTTADYAMSVANQSRTEAEALQDDELKRLEGRVTRLEDTMDALIAWIGFRGRAE